MNAQLQVCLDDELIQSLGWSDRVRHQSCWSTYPRQVIFPLWARRNVNHPNNNHDKKDRRRNIDLTWMQYANSNEVMVRRRHSPVPPCLTNSSRSLPSTILNFDRRYTDHQMNSLEVFMMSYFCSTRKYFVLCASYTFVNKVTRAATFWMNFLKYILSLLIQ